MHARAIPILILFSELLLTSAGAFTKGDGPKSDFVAVQVEAGDAPFISWLKPLPLVGRNFAAFFLNPREFTAAWVANPSTRPSPWLVLLSSLTLTAVLYAIYAAVFHSSPFGRLFPNPSVTTGEVTAAKGSERPRIIGFAMKQNEIGRSMDGQVVSQRTSRGFGFGGEFPEVLLKGTQVPQIAVFKLGLVNLIVADIIPESFATKSTQTLFLIVFGLIAAISSFPGAWLLGTTSTFADTFAFTITTFTYCLLFWLLLILLAVFLVRDLLKIDLVKKFQTITNARQFAVGWGLGCLWLMIAFLPVIRSVYVSYSEFYSANFWRMIVIILSGMLLSAIAAPVIFVPFCYIWLKINKLLEAMI